MLRKLFEAQLPVWITSVVLITAALLSDALWGNGWSIALALAIVPSLAWSTSRHLVTLRKTACAERFARAGIVASGVALTSFLDPFWILTYSIGAIVYATLVISVVGYAMIGLARIIHNHRTQRFLSSRRTIDRGFLFVLLSLLCLLCELFINHIYSFSINNRQTASPLLALSTVCLLGIARFRSKRFATSLLVALYFWVGYFATLLFWLNPSLPLSVYSIRPAVAFVAIASWLLYYESCSRTE